MSPPEPDNARQEHHATVLVDRDRLSVFFDLSCAPPCNAGGFFRVAPHASFFRGSGADCPATFLFLRLLFSMAQRPPQPPDEIT